MLSTVLRMGTNTLAQYLYSYHRSRLVMGMRFLQVTQEDMEAWRLRKGRGAEDPLTVQDLPVAAAGAGYDFV
jgi:hypothetical protein